MLLASAPVDSPAGGVDTGTVVVEPKIRVVAPGEAERAGNVQLLAFSTDPVIRWLWRPSDAYVRNFPRFLRAFAGRAFEAGTAHVRDDFLAGSLWLSPEMSPDGDALEALMRETLVEPVSSEIGGMTEQVSAAHPEVPHWHLVFLGVDPTLRGRGIGSAILQYGLERVDADGAVAYLESSNPANVPLYQRHGFEVLREIRVGSSPPLFPMLRAAR